MIKTTVKLHNKCFKYEVKMLIDNSNKLSNLSFLENFFVKQDKLKILITCLACAILFTATATLFYRRFWQERKVQNISSQPDLPVSQPNPPLPTPQPSLSLPTPQPSPLLPIPQSSPPLSTPQPSPLLQNIKRESFIFASPSVSCLSNDLTMTEKQMSDLDQGEPDSWIKTLNPRRKLSFDDIPVKDQTSTSTDSPKSLLVDSEDDVIEKENSQEKLSAPVVAEGLSNVETPQPVEKTPEVIEQLLEKTAEQKEAAQEEKDLKEPSQDIEVENAQAVAPLTPVIDGTAFLFISSPHETGLVGTDLDRIPHINRFKLADKSPLPLAADDQLLVFMACQVENIKKLPEPFYLPAALIKGKEDGEMLQLYFDDQLIEFTINQTKADPKRRYFNGTFEQALYMACHTAQEKNCTWPMFGITTSDLYDWYGLKGGTVYEPTLLKEQGKEKIYQLQVVAADRFRPLQRTAEVLDPNVSGNRRKNRHRKTSPKAPSVEIIKPWAADVISNSKNQEYHILGDVGGLDLGEESDYVQFILNQDYLGVHIFIHLKSRFDPNIKFTPKEYVRAFSWKKIFTDCTLAQVQAKLAKSHLYIKEGELELIIPLDEPPTSPQMERMSGDYPSR